MLNTLGRDTYLRAVQYENKNVINSSLDCLQAFSQNPNKNIELDKNGNVNNIELDKNGNVNDNKYKDNNYGINFNEIGNKSVSMSPMKNKSGLKLNLQYSSSFEEDLGQRK